MTCEEARTAIFLAVDKDALKKAVATFEEVVRRDARQFGFDSGWHLRERVGYPTK